MRIASLMLAILTVLFVWIGNRHEPSTRQQKNLVVVFSDQVKYGVRETSLEDAEVVVVTPCSGWREGDVAFFRNEQGTVQLHYALDAQNRVVYAKQD